MDAKPSKIERIFRLLDVEGAMMQSGLTKGPKKSSPILARLCQGRELSCQSLYKAICCHNVLANWSEFRVQIQSIEYPSGRGLTGCDWFSQKEQVEAVLMRGADGGGSAPSDLAPRPPFCGSREEERVC
jgi:hypothetical protein